MELLTVEEYKNINNLNKAAESDTVAAIKAANNFITRWLNFSTDPELIEVNKNRDKYFVSPAVSSIESVTALNGSEVTGFHYLGTGIIIFPVIPTPGYYKVLCNYTSFEGAVPDDLKYAVALYVDFLVKGDYRESRTFGGETVQFTTKSTGIPTHIRSILELYRNY